MEYILIGSNDFSFLDMLFIYNYYLFWFINNSDNYFIYGKY